MYKEPKTEIEEGLLEVREDEELEELDHVETSEKQESTTSIQDEEEEEIFSFFGNPHTSSLEPRKTNNTRDLRYPSNNQPYQYFQNDSSPCCYPPMQISYDKSNYPSES